MNILITNNSRVPLYEQIKRQIKNGILKEELKEGEQLPSIRQFATDLQVSVLTIRRVYNELEDEGFVTSQAGLGTFVAAGNLELLQDARQRQVENKMQELINLAQSLQITTGELHLMLDILSGEEDK